ncbi:hypothetical protein AGR1B_pTi0174 [Agrobacterium fabacearum S56]|uniref:Uncharacterized protein n=1 Tax=Agrobacterium deltaense Zutra 3/1 TaxID=1183427 RepID=A0A1S7S4S3_9HYPH|nr:hypothetical protein AGR1B_pTi0174 [Agrobacterium fabacearum S56]CUX62668.1 hypothetical protein AGR7C_pTi0008 [Agrobacterium deltaense Zutra 3/1]
MQKTYNKINTQRTDHNTQIENLTLQFIYSESAGKKPTKRKRH